MEWVRKLNEIKPYGALDDEGDKNVEIVKDEGPEL
jgi:hypothetical protein